MVVSFLKNRKVKCKWHPVENMCGGFLATVLGIFLILCQGGCDVPLNVYGQVVDGENEPIVNARVELTTMRKTLIESRLTDDQGTFSFECTGTSGEYRVVVSKDGVGVKEKTFQNDPPGVRLKFSLGR